MFVSEFVHRQTPLPYRLPPLMIHILNQQRSRECFDI